MYQYIIAILIKLRNYNFYHYFRKKVTFTYVKWKIKNQHILVFIKVMWYQTNNHQKSKKLPQNF